MNRSNLLRMWSGCIAVNKEAELKCLALSETAPLRVETRPAGAMHWRIIISRWFCSANVPTKIIISFKYHMQISHFIAAGQSL